MIDIIPFLAATFFLLITPGPGVLSTAGVAAGFGARQGLIYVTGLCIGSNLVTLIVVTGYAALLLSLPVIKPFLLTASFCYLSWLALKIAFAGKKLSFINATRPVGIADAIFLQLINPKAYVVMTALFGGFHFADYSYIGGTILKIILLNLIWIPIHILWLWAGIKLHQLQLSTKQQFIVNIIMASAMILVVIIASFTQDIFN